MLNNFPKLLSFLAHSHVRKIHKTMAARCQRAKTAEAMRTLGNAIIAVLS